MGTENNERISSGDMYQLEEGEVIYDPRGGPSISGPGFVRIYLNDYGAMAQELIGTTKIFVEGASDPEQIITKPSD